jgi:hypothetical protein
VSWLIVGLLGLVFLGGLLLFIWGRGRSRPSADDTLVTDLLGAADHPAVPAARARREGVPSPAAQGPGEGRLSPAPQGPGDGQPSAAGPASGEDQRSPAPTVPPATEENWLETQLAWINAWSQQMNQQITSTEQPEPGRQE